MAKSANLYARIEPDVKEQAEGILNALGIPASNAITMFYKQIILQKGLPFEVKLPEHPLNVSQMTAAQMPHCSVKPKIHPDAFVAPDAAIYGDVTVDQGCSIWFHATVRGEHASIVIRKGSNVQDNSVVHVDAGYQVEIGEYVTIGHGAIVHGCKIGDYSLIGMGAIILNGANIGKNCIVGAGALVTQNTVVPDGSLLIGCPAKIMRSVTEEEMEANLVNARHYVEEGEKYKKIF